MAQHELEIVSGSGSALLKVYLEPVRMGNDSVPLHRESDNERSRYAACRKEESGGEENSFQDDGARIQRRWPSLLFTAAAILSVTAAWLIASF